MTNPPNMPNSLRTRVLEFLYGGMTPEQEATFQQDLAVNADLAQCLAQEKAGLHSLIPAGDGVTDLPVGALEESRLLLRGALRQQRQAGSFSGWLRSWLARLTQATTSASPLALAGGATAALVLGVLLGQAGPSTPSMTDSLVDVQVTQYDESTGRVELELVGLATTRLRGHLTDAPVQAALTAAMLGDLEPAPRLMAVGLLRQQTQSAAIRTALTQALLQDSNPGVRMAAAEALSGLAADGTVRQALQKALLADDNAGVRVAAIQGLRHMTDIDTRQVLERVRYSEVNEYIRTEARRALDEDHTDRAQQPTHL